VQGQHLCRIDTVESAPASHEWQGAGLANAHPLRGATAAKSGVALSVEISEDVRKVNRRGALVGSRLRWTRLWVRSQLANQTMTLVLKEVDSSGKVIGSSTAALTFPDVSWHQLSTTGIRA
jgi:hypothetical protein